jgi:hypothetical protein
MKRTLVILFAFVLFTPAIKAQDFKPGCEFPLQLKTLKEKQKVDSSCGIAGDGSAASKAQNTAKNNFCAKGSPIQVSVVDLTKLYNATATRLANASIPFGSPSSIPTDRTLLATDFVIGGKHLSEGKLVGIIAYVLDARHSNVSNGEKVNCDITGRKGNDIHIELASRRDSDPCNSITAEISPHARPEVWDQFDDYDFTNPVMMVGNLFFDASHKPCSGPGTPNEKRVHPTRISSWEIHPVYAIFVCKNSTIAACPFNDSSKWVAFDKWVTLPDDKDANEP